MSKVSVIIPVYNADKYLCRCVDSVLNQTLKDIEIILVDDGSTDNSPAICDEYERKYDNIKVFHKENGGVSSARNVGLDNATGEYIGFIDSDDYIAPEMYEKLYQSSEEHHCEMGMCNYQIVKNNSKICMGKIDFPENRRVDEDEMKILMQTSNERRFLWFVWKSIYKRDLLQRNGIRFIDGNIIEDTPFNMEAMLCSDGMVFINRPLYYYEQTDNSLMRSKHKHNYLEKLENLYKAKQDILSRYHIDGVILDMCQYTMTHTILLLLENELHYKRSLSEKIEVYRKMRNSRMIADAMKHSNPMLIKSRIKYLVLLLKYRCYVLLALLTN